MGQIDRKHNTIAIVATGDEIVNGDVLNTNAPFLCSELINHGIQPGMQVTVADEQDRITDAIRYLLETHGGLITIGGLGPTSDDRTRFALSAALNLPLEYDDASWQMIIKRLNLLNLTAPESNRQQAMFPKGSSVLINNNGTANACYLEHEGKFIFMLPGPPREFKPLVNAEVIPRLIKTPLKRSVFRKHWLLIGASEGHIADQIDQLAEHYDCTVGYRVNYPYIEFKCHATSQPVLNTFSAAVLPLIQHYIVSETNQTASQQLKEWLLQSSYKISITDGATGGQLQAALLNPHTQSQLTFNADNNADIKINIQGFKEYWNENSDALDSPLLLSINAGDKPIEHEYHIRLRGPRTMEFCVEWLCWQILKSIQTTE